MADANTTNPYSRLLWWEVENFMSIEKARVEFDEQNIINLKGYNDSGKSAMLTALKVLLCNTAPTKQVGFIQDGKDYFRVIATFSDGIQILRDKYINGQSLYEMYSNGQCIFSTKNGKTLSKVSDVPKPIEDYLGLIMYDDVCLNSRSCFEKQIGVQTTGSENYKMFNTVLKSEEIATASGLINTDKNKLVADISAVSAQIEANKGLLGRGAKVTTDMINYLKEHDNLADLSELQLKSLIEIQEMQKSVADIQLHIPPEIEVIEADSLNLLEQIESLVAQIEGISIPPDVPELDNQQLLDLINIQSMLNTYNSIIVLPEISTVDTTQLETLKAIAGLVEQISAINTTLKDDETRLAEINTQLDTLQNELVSFGVKLVKCPDCGCLFDPSVGHTE